MKVLISTKKIEVTEGMNNHIKMKAEYFIDKYFQDENDVADVSVKLKLDKDIHVAEIVIRFHAFLIRGEARSKDMYVSIDDAFAKIETQYRKHKGRLNRKHHRIGLKEISLEQNEVEANLEIFRRKKFPLKPMTEEEALLQMNLVGHQFFVFLNANSNHINVVYKRSQDTYGIIETEV